MEEYGVGEAASVLGVSADTVRHCMVALINREAAEDLDLRPGTLVRAIVKATNVSVERARP